MQNYPVGKELNKLTKFYFLQFFGGTLELILGDSPCKYYGWRLDPVSHFDNSQTVNVCSFGAATFVDRDISLFCLLLSGRFTQVLLYVNAHVYLSDYFDIG